jgi:hypothetical protein
MKPWQVCVRYAVKVLGRLRTSLQGCTVESFTEPRSSLLIARKDVGDVETK